MHEQTVLYDVADDVESEDSSVKRGEKLDFDEKTPLQGQYQ